MSVNRSLSSLTVSLLSTSPLFSLPRSVSPFYFQVKFSKFSNFASNMLRSHSGTAGISLKSSVCSNFIESAVHVNAATNKPYFRDQYNNRLNNANVGLNVSTVACQEMIFINCTTLFDGGAVFCVTDGDFYCNFSAFHQCWTKSFAKGGAVFCIANNTNFTGSCFSECSSYRGSAVSSPETTLKASFELCQMNNIVPPTYDNKPSMFCFDITARNILFVTTNLSHSEIYSAAKLEPFVKLAMSLNHFQNISTGSQQSMIILKRMNANMKTERFNILGNNAKEGYILNIAGFSVNLKEMVVIQNEFRFFLNTNNANLSIILDFCTFNCTENQIVNTNEYNGTTSVFNKASATVFPMDIVSTLGCWAHSTYKFLPGETWKQGIVLGILVFSTALAIVAVVIHKKILDSQRQTGEDEDYDALLNGE